MADILAQVQGMTTDPRGTEVQVEVAGPRHVPRFFKETRARARAIVAAGALPTGRDTVEDLTMGEINRLTTVDLDPVVEEAGTLMESLLYNVIVNRGEP